MGKLQRGKGNIRKELLTQGRQAHISASKVAADWLQRARGVQTGQSGAQTSAREPKQRLEEKADRLDSECLAVCDGAQAETASP